MKKTKLVIHIGRPKTGSTALQRFLFESKPQLRKLGVLYPIAGNYQNASHLYAYAYEAQMRKAANLAEINGELLFEEMKAEAQRANAHTIVLSSENFWFIDPTRLPATLDEDFEVSILAYVRRQDSVMISSFCEEVKRGIERLDSDLEVYAMNPDRIGLLDYSLQLNKWVQRFSESQVNVRPYEHAQVSGVAEDFCQFLELDSTGLDVEGQIANPSLPYDILSLIDYVGRIKMGDQVKRRFITSISETVGVLDYSPQYDASGLFSNELRARILKNYEDSNEQVKRLCRDSDAELFPPLQLAESTAPTASITVERLSRLMLGLQAQNERVHLKLDNRLRRLEQAVARQDNKLKAMAASKET